MAIYAFCKFGFVICQDCKVYQKKIINEENDLSLYTLKLELSQNVINTHLWCLVRQSILKCIQQTKCQADARY